MRKRTEIFMKTQKFPRAKIHREKINKEIFFRFIGNYKMYIFFANFAMKNFSRFGFKYFSIDFS